jgi:hypothetical protein
MERLFTPSALRTLTCRAAHSRQTIFLSQKIDARHFYPRFSYDLSYLRAAGDFSIERWK